MRGPAESERRRWDRKHRERGYDPGLEPTSLLRQAVEEHGLGRVAGGSGARALDLACGRGRNSLFLAQEGCEVTAVDISPVALAHCRRGARERGVEITTVCADLADLDLGRGRWDLIVDVYFLDRRLLRRIPQALAEGGSLVLEHFTVEHPEVSDFGPRRPEHLLQLGEALAALDSLELLSYREGVVEVDEGTHSGRAGLVRLVARRP